MISIQTLHHIIAFQHLFLTSQNMFPMFLLIHLLVVHANQNHRLLHVNPLLAISNPLIKATPHGSKRQNITRFHSLLVNQMLVQTWTLALTEQTQMLALIAQTQMAALIAQTQTSALIAQTQTSALIVQTQMSLLI